MVAKQRLAPDLFGRCATRDPLHRRHVPAVRPYFGSAFHGVVLPRIRTLAGELRNAPEITTDRVTFWDRPNAELVRIRTMEHGARLEALATAGAQFLP